MLPGIDGFEVCRRIRAAGQVPIIMLTARSDDFDVVSGLEAGADDYVVKPVQPRGARRPDPGGAAPLRPRAGARPAAYGDLATDRHVRRLTIDRAGCGQQGRRAGRLTPTELRLLLDLSATPGQVFSRQQLLEAVWEHDYLGDSRLVDACVQRLRAKIEDAPRSPDVRPDRARLRLPVRPAVTTVRRR